MNRLSMCAAVAATLALPILAAHAGPKASISPKDAMKTAAKAIPGTAQKVTHEYEDNRWQYAVIVKGANNQLWEVEVSDSKPGTVLDKEKTSVAEEAKEAAADAKAAQGKKGK